MIKEKGTGSGEWKGERWIGGGIHVGVGSTTWVGVTTAISRPDGRPENQHSGRAVVLYRGRNAFNRSYKSCSRIIPRRVGG